jgi:hypothetical protein
MIDDMHRATRLGRPWASTLFSGVRVRLVVIGTDQYPYDILLYYIAAAYWQNLCRGNHNCAAYAPIRIAMPPDTPATPYSSFTRSIPQQRLGRLLLGFAAAVALRGEDRSQARHRRY